MGEAKPTLFLSDLHLPPDASALRERFQRFLTGPAREATAVYILGDLFESWIGDDVGMQIYAAEVGSLAALTAQGVPVYFQHGNRDFMVGADFFALTGVRALPDPHTIELQGRATLISHGDLLCTDDVGYQRWRRFSRTRWAQWIFLRLPRARREKIAGGLRSGSDTAKRNKAENIMDVNARAVRSLMAQHGVTQLIHGHTHRPGTYAVDLPIGMAQRIVLPDWHGEVCDYLRFGAEAVQRESVG